MIFLAVFGSMAVCSPAHADEMPVFRQGMWKFQRTVGTKTIEMTKCSSPTEDMKKQNAMLKKVGCRFSPAKKSGNTYTFTADCSIQGPSGAVTSSRSTTVITVESDSAYRVEINGSADGQATKELLVAQRIGDCKK
ncbi:MAG: DUF3617 family protein [Deltaproteobacteria bacterium]|nr:DUF3617 family protein [Deltaproteobacteria bacterium]